MTDNEKLQGEPAALSDEQAEQVRSLVTEGVREALRQAAAEENLSPSDRMRAGYANKPAA